MPRFVVLLRGVNVGKGNRVPMADFRAVLESLGCTDVKTLLNSGNAVFASASRGTGALARSIGDALRDRLEVETPVIVKSAAEFAAIIDNNPIVPPESDHSKFLVAFAMDPKQLAGLESLKSLQGTGERFALTKHAAYLHCAGGLLDSAMGKAILGKVGRDVTTRNWGTTLRLSALLGEG